MSSQSQRILINKIFFFYKKTQAVFLVLSNVVIGKIQFFINMYISSGVNNVFGTG